MKRCKFGLALASAEVREAYESGATADRLAAIARESLFSVSASTVRSHRRGACVCVDERGPRILILDIETSPNLAHVWGLFKQTVSLSQLRESTRMIAFAAKWLGEPESEFWSVHHDGHRAMVERAHALLDEADVLVTYNGVGFDLKHLRREFLLEGMAPPAPWKDVDLLNVVKGQFRFVSNKLDHVATELGLGSKVSHSGHDLWVRCMAGDPEAWETMKVYNLQDVALTEAVYVRLLPWVKGHPHFALYTDEEGDVCGRCGSRDLEPVDDTAKTGVSGFPLFVCGGCGSYSRGGRRVRGVDVRPV